MNTKLRFVITYLKVNEGAQCFHHVHVDIALIDEQTRLLQDVIELLRRLAAATRRSNILAGGFLVAIVAAQNVF